MVQKWVKSILYAGHVEEKSAEVRKQILISSLFSLISLILLIIFGLENLCTGRDQLAVIVLCGAVISGINYLFLRRTARYKISSVIIVVMMTILGLYLLCTGGNDNTGPLWLFVLPGLIFYILGLRRGGIWVALLVLLITYILLYPDNLLLQNVYSASFISRFLGAFVSTCIVSFVYEYTREDGRREQMALSRRLDYLSRKDELTGLSNRRDMFEKLRAEVRRFERTDKPFSVLLGDVDRFKEINDSGGHECGDFVLRQIARVLRENTQKRDLVARWGGEEFLIFLPETLLEQALAIGERLRGAVEKTRFSYSERDMVVTISIGAAQFDQEQNINALINAADRQLYRAKSNGRNRVE